jgi:hypothetical protein
MLLDKRTSRRAYLICIALQALGGRNMEELDRLVRERFIPFRERLTSIISSKHPYIITMLEAVTMDHDNKVGLQITEGGQPAGEYTLHLSGINITRAEGGKLEAEVQHPILGLMRPCVVVERAGLERLIAAEDKLVSDFYDTLPSHLPDFSVKFL